MMRAVGQNEGFGFADQVWPQLGSLCEGFRVLGSLPVTSVDVSVVYMIHECSDWSEVSQQTLNPTPTTPPEPAVIGGFAAGR